MITQKLIFAALGSLVIGAMLAPQASNAAVLQMIHPTVVAKPQPFRPVTDVTAVKTIPVIALPQKAGPVVELPMQPIKPVAGLKPVEIVPVVSTQANKAGALKAEEAALAKAQAAAAAAKKKQGDVILAKGGRPGQPKPDVGGTSYNPTTNTTTTWIWHPERDVGGGMKEKAHWEKIVEAGDTTGKYVF